MFFGGDPFEHFAGMHGGHGGGGSARGAPKKAVDTTKLYETLGVSYVLPKTVPLCSRLRELSTSLRTWRTMRSKDGCRKKLFRRWNIH
jgi:hypothetical protein